MTLVFTHDDGNGDPFNLQLMSTSFKVGPSSLVRVGPSAAFTRAAMVRP